MKNCPGYPHESCRDRIPDGWTYCQRCRARRNAERERTKAAHQPVDMTGPAGAPSLNAEAATDWDQRGPASQEPATGAPGACEGGHPTGAPVPAVLRLVYRAPSDGAVLAVEQLCQPCADAAALPWVKTQRTPLLAHA